MQISDSTLLENRYHREAQAGFAVYVCPQCKIAVSASAEELLCQHCSRRYPLHNTIPDFLGKDLLNNRNWSLRHAALFDWLAPIYETRLWYPVVMRLAGVKGFKSLSELREKVATMIGPITGSVLDVACGPGTFGRGIARECDFVCGIDISLGMLEQGEAYSRRERIPNIQFARAAVEALPFAQNAFAAAVCCGSLHLFEDTASALHEIARVLTPAAQIAGFTFAARDSRFSRLAIRHGARLFEADQLGVLFEEAGFERYRAQTFGSVLLFSAYKTQAISACYRRDSSPGGAQ